MNNPAFPDFGNLWRDLLRQWEDAGNSLGTDAMQHRYLDVVQIDNLAPEEAFLIAPSKDLEKLVAQMTIDQQGAIAVCESTGFRGEAPVRNHLKGADGRKHDIVLLSHDVVQSQAKMEMYGIADVF